MSDRSEERAIVDTSVIDAIAHIFRPITQPSPGAKPSYDMMSDALIWSDEMEFLRTGYVGELGEWSYIRTVWNYRTSLIMQAPRLEYAPYWNRALELFPDWIGFLPERREPQGDLQELFARSNSKGEEEMDRLFKINDRLERMRARRENEGRQ